VGVYDCRRDSYGSVSGIRGTCFEVRSRSSGLVSLRIRKRMKFKCGILMCEVFGRNSLSLYNATKLTRNVHFFHSNSNRFLNYVI
jgi:hypothetical protein